MNHRKSLRKLNRTTAHRRALRRNLAQSLFEHGQVRTTVPKAKDLRPFAERLITLAKRARRGSLIARRRLLSLMADRSLIPADHRDAYEALSDAKRRQALVGRSGRRYRTGAPKGRQDFTGESVSHRLIETIAPRFEDRPGGYTRIICLADRRLGDKSKLAIVQLVGDEQRPTSVARPRKNTRRIKADARYAAAFQATRGAAAGRPRHPDTIAREQPDALSQPPDEAAPSSTDDQESPPA